MIYSITQNKYVPITVEKQSAYEAGGFDDFLIRYSVYDASTTQKEYVGYMNLQDTKNGVKVLYVKNEHPNLYRHFYYVADQIKVEHCLKRGIDRPYIFSVAALDTYVVHFKRGMRFINEGINVYLESITKNLKKVEKISTEALGFQKMYMPVNMLNEIKDKIKLNPLLKGLK